MSNPFFAPALSDLDSRVHKALDSFTTLKPSEGFDAHQYERRLSWELEYIRNAGLGPYIAAVTELVDHARAQGILVGPGRGSSPSSLVLYFLGVTGIDPVAHGLIVERWFSNPVIEIDVEWHRRAELIDHLWRRYGQDRTAYISTYRRDKATGEILSRGIHAACFAVSSTLIADIVPTWTCGDGRLVIDAERDAVEERGIGVLTILGMKQLSVVAEGLRLIGAGDPSSHRYGLTGDDTDTMEVFRSGDTDDLFLFGSEGMKELLARAQPETQTDLLCLNAVYRPTFIQDGTVDELARRMIAGHRPAPGNEDRFPEIEIADIQPVGEVLSDTFGLLLFQEQFIEIVHQLTRWSYLEAELYRRRAEKNAKSRAFQDELLGVVRDRYTIEAEKEESLRRLIERSRQTYLKAHAESYLRVALQMASLKARDPTKFSEAVGRVFGLHP